MSRIYYDFIPETASLIGARTGTTPLPTLNNADSNTMTLIKTKI